MPRLEAGGALRGPDPRQLAPLIAAAEPALTHGDIAGAVAAAARAAGLAVPAAILLLTHALRVSARLAAAEAVCRHGLAGFADLPMLWVLLGSIRNGQGQGALAAACLRHAVALAPGSVAVHLHLTRFHRDAGHFPEAAASARHVVALQPNLPEGWVEMGRIGVAQGRWDEAAQGFRQAIVLRPDNIPALTGLGRLRLNQEYLDEAVQCFQAIIALDPGAAGAHAALAVAALKLGDAAGAVDGCRRALILNPDDDPARRRLLVAPLYEGGGDDDVDRLFDEHRRFGARHDRVVAQPPANDPDPERRLRIGYLSADFRADHPVARNLFPLFAAHDRGRFALFGYAQVARPDDGTRRFQEHADGWRDITGLDDAAAAESIRADGIDILVSLAGRFEPNRPLICAHRPAPVQISFHDVATSGLAAMDYLIADPVLCPRHTRERFTERVLRLPGFYLGETLDQAPPVAEPPGGGAGRVTFACFNHPAKLGPAVLALWAQLLARLPEARLLLRYASLYHSARLRRRIADGFAAHGVDPARIDMRTGTEPLAGHLALYNQIDIALDPFPFCGSTTTFEALWMGVPVVTWPRATMVSRWSASMLTTLGLTDLIAGSAGEYLAIAEDLARNPQRRTALRAILRDRVAASPLCDARLKARHLERLYRAVWRRWCRGLAPSGPAPSGPAPSGPAFVPAKGVAPPAAIR